MTRDEIEIGEVDMEALEYLVEFGYLAEPANGIIQQVISRGEQSLSEKQERVYRKYVLEPYFAADCSLCYGPIPGSERIGAWENEGMCSWCINKVAKDD